MDCSMRELTFKDRKERIADAVVLTRDLLAIRNTVAIMRATVAGGLLFQLSAFGRLHV
ncbi:hypothetical protein Plhal304r1_c031g0102081 [Plasmopara halstedii]